MKEEDTTMRVEEVASPLPMIHAGSAMLSPRARAGSVSGGAGGGGSGAAAGSAMDPALLASYRQRMIDALQLTPAGVLPSEFDKWGDKDAVVITMNKLLTDRQIALFTSASGDMFIKLVDEEHLADLRCVRACGGAGGRRDGGGWWWWCKGRGVVLGGGLLVRQTQPGPLPPSLACRWDQPCEVLVLTVYCSAWFVVQCGGVAGPAGD